MIYQNYIKRFFDFSFALVGLIILSPVLIMVTIALFFANGGKPFFVQERPGYRERIFRIIKFKSMNDARDKDGLLLPDKDRLTKIGAFVRKTSLDEIPQLINVIKGEMSIVGPRPLLVSYLPYYSEREKLRHTVKPGITGLAQVNGRNNLNWNDRLEMDAKYVEKMDVQLDLIVLIKTLKKVIKKDDIVVALDPEINVPLNIFRALKK